MRLSGLTFRAIIGLVTGILCGIVCLISPLTAQEPEPPKGEDLCSFGADLFTALDCPIQKKELLARLRLCDPHGDQRLQEILNVLIAHLESGQEDELSEAAIVEAVSSLGRLFKASSHPPPPGEVDPQHPKGHYLLSECQVSGLLKKMEDALEGRIPSTISSYHKLMIESLARGQYALALYAYLKISQTDAGQTPP